MKEKLKRLLPSRRKIMQLYFAVLFNANLKGFVSGTIFRGSSKQFCTPGLNCYSCPGATGACPLGALQGAFSAERSTLYYMVGTLALYGLMFGRMICGWFCPFGLIQELLYKVKTPKLPKSPLTWVLSFGKYVVLIFFVLIVPILYALRNIPLPAFCKYICPAGTLEGGIALLSNAVNESYFAMLGPLFTWKFLLLVSLLTASVFIFRVFCRFLCPLGAIYGLFNKFSFFGVTVEDSKCIGCGKCVNHCKMDIRHVADAECISCGECIDVCPTQAIRFKGGKAVLHPNEGTAKPRRRVLQLLSAVILLAILVGTIGYYWSHASVESPLSGQNKSFSLELLGETGLTGEMFAPTATGKITVLNFWGTWCTPCIQELPYFHRLAQDYPDRVAVVAVHTHALYETAPEFIAANYPDTGMLFAKDSPADEAGIVGSVYTALGGRGTYPYTVILDPSGAVLQVFHTALEYEDLKQAVEAHLPG